MTHELLSFKNRYEKKGIIQKINSFEMLFLAFKKNVIRTKETVEEYQKGDREFKLKCKDKGGFIAGQARENQRSNVAILTRNMITLDMDYCPSNILDILRKKQDIDKVLNFQFFVYSTHSHTPEKPRLRILVPLKEEITVEKYEPIARLVAQKIGMEYFDATTFQPNRIMYFPSVSIDGEYVCESFGFEDWFDLNPDEYLDEYMDYLNVDEWAKPHYMEGLKAEKLERGTTKDSTKTRYKIVNAFNVEYSITQALDEFLTDEYIKERGDRYTFSGGESKSGLVILNSQYAYSHHATDPAQGRILNAFDIVRIHKFGKYDSVNEQEAGEQNGNKLASFEKMRDWIVANLPAVVKNLPEFKEVDERKEEHVEGSKVDEEVRWEHRLDWIGKDNDRHPKSNAKNVVLILENDVLLKDLFFYDTLKGQICFQRAPFWNKDTKNTDSITDLDDSELRVYLSSVYQITGKDFIYDSVLHVANKKRINYMKLFLSKLPEWDGIPRVETIFVDLFKVEDNEFIREATKKWFIGHVRRILQPGCKHDYTICLMGKKGIGKSQIGKSIATPYWPKEGMAQIDNETNAYIDDEIPLNSKDAYDLIRGKAIVELAEFDKYYKKYDFATIKSYMTKTHDRYRESFGRRTIEVPRSSVFIATSNDLKPVRDLEGERRLFPFYSRLEKYECRIYDNELWNEEIRNQCLAESLHYYNEGYNPMSPFTSEQVKIWDRLNESATTENDALPLVEVYVKNKFPTFFFNYSFAEMKKYWSEKVTHEYDANGEKYDFIGRNHREEFSIREIWCFAFNRDIGSAIDYNIRAQIVHSLEKLGYIKTPGRKTQGVFGQQHTYILELKEGNEVQEDDLPF